MANQIKTIEDANHIDREALHSDIKMHTEAINQYKDGLDLGLPHYFSLRENLIDKVEPFSSLRKRGYYSSKDYELRIRDLTKDSGKLIFFDYGRKISDIELFTFDSDSDIIDQLKKPAKKILKRLKKLLK